MSSGDNQIQYTSKSHETETNELKKHITYLDTLRAISCFTVVMLHVSALNTYHVAFQSHEWNVFMFYESIVNWAVPMFVMISGAVMLNKEYTYKDILIRCKNIVCFFLVWSALYLVFDIINNGFQPYNDMLWLQVLFQGHYHMWYLIMLFGLYLLVPMIKPIIDNPELREAFVSLSVIFTFAIPTIRDLSLLNGIGYYLRHPLIGSLFRAFNNVYDDLNFHFTLGFVAYFILGYVLAHCVVIMRQKVLAIALWLTMIGTSILFLEIRIAASKEAAAVFMQHYQLGVLMQTCGLFLLVRILSENKFMIAMANISPLSLGIYMLHPIIIEILQKNGITSLSFSPIISVPVISIGVFILSAGMSYFLKKTPLERLFRIGGKK